MPERLKYVLAIGAWAIATLCWIVVMVRKIRKERRARTQTLDQYID